MLQNFASANSFNPRSNPVREELGSPLFVSGGNQGTERYGDLPKVTQLVRGRAGILPRWSGSGCVCFFFMVYICYLFLPLEKASPSREGHVPLFPAVSPGSSSGLGAL